MKGDAQFINDEFIVGGLRSEGVYINFGSYYYDTYCLFIISIICDSLSNDEL